MSAIVLESGMVHYEVLGRGRPIIFLHGWVGSWRYWIPAMQSLSTNYRAYALDLWGFGDTAKSRYNYSLPRQAALLGRFLDEMGIGRVALIGHALGAMVALQFASQQPTAVDRLMLVGLPLYDADLDARMGMQSPAELANWLLTQDPENAAARSEALKADQKAIQASLDDMKAIDPSELFRQLNISSLLVHSQNDPAVRTRNIGEDGFMSNLTHQVIFKQSGHFPMLDESNKFNRLVADFMALGSGESPRRLQLKEEWKRRVR
jgi:pimeloyl-ACP methyl ester carboxylesterase